MTRKSRRAIAILALIGASLLLIFLGSRGWAFYQIPLQLVGYMTAAVAALGILGVNVWYGGPLDPRFDEAAQAPPQQIGTASPDSRRWGAVLSAIPDWGPNWEHVPPASGLQRELERELTSHHPLATRSPMVVGRCRSCDDVVAALDAGEGSELAVIHLTWRGKPEQPGWPDFERMTVEEFTARFLRSTEHT